MMEIKSFVVDLARNAGALLKKKFNKTHKIQFKGDINLVTEADKMSENLIIKSIRRAFPDHGILSEESPAVAGSGKIRWIVDPLDGTTNYAHGYPVFCVSIALENDGNVVLGVIYDPMREELFSTVRGKGVYLNGKKLSVSSIRDISRSLLATGFPYDIRESRENNLDYFSRMAVNVQAIRRAGAAALDLAYLAAGRFDGFWELKLKPWDTAAGCLMVEEAGGSVSDLAGKPWNISSPSVLASNGFIHKKMIRIFR
ncbi:MAG TPA: inositol monophosphatase family protein [Smithella sp.]|nr:inositol monophosphatase family protein [Smithella sp.]